MTEQPTVEPRSRQPDFGPGGYLPDRAARRARKIILRSAMGAGWPLAALAAAVVLLVAGGVFVLTRLGGPGAPFVAVAEFADVAPRSTTSVAAEGGTDLLLVHTGSALRAFEMPAGEVVLCRASNHLETQDGVWDLGGRSLVGTDSLASYPVRVHDGTVYVDTSEPRAPTAPVAGDRQVTPACD